MSNGNGHRWSKFFWSDWKKDDELLGCSLAARGLWMALLCIAHEADPCGYVLINGKAPTAKDLAVRLGNTTPKEITKLLAELEAAGVFSRTDDGTIYSRRMKRDTAASEAGREHIAKRWKEQKPNSPPNRVPTSKPNGVGHSPPTARPITREADTDSEVEAEEEKVKIYNNPLSPSTPARAETQQSDALDELLDEAGIEKPRIDRSNDPEKLSEDPAIEAQLRRLTKTMQMRTGDYGVVRSVEAQLDALKAQPAAVGADVTMGLRWQAPEPALSVEAQIAAALAAASPEQIEKARRYTERITQAATA